MNPSRRFVLMGAGVAALAGSAAAPARAADYPTRPVRILVPVAPGGALDINARIIARWLSERLGQQFIVENKPGAATNLAVGEVARAAPDGYTLLLVPGSVSVNATLFTNLNFVFLRDIAPVAMLSKLPLVMQVNLAVPAKTVPEFIAWAKANAGKVNMATSGNGTPHHMAGALFNQMTGTDITPVPFQGGAPGLVALMGDQVHVMFSPLPESLGAIQGGKVRALAVTTAQRLEVLPDVPTVAESVPGFEASSWQGVGVPAATPREIVDLLNREINAGLADPAVRKSLADLGSLPTAMSSAQFRAMIAEETEKWAKVIRAANIKIE
jgi:tripartite-type tricarboxylate transporter receptor subunit TctC